MPIGVLIKVETIIINFQISGSDVIKILKESLEQHRDISQPPVKLLIHVGTPKTGTTSLQIYLDKKQRKLRSKGILYPHNLDSIPNPNAPKHQWFEKNLISGHLDNFVTNFKNIISQVKLDTHTIILSSEGIFNYWWDLPSQSKALLSELTSLFDIQVLVWFREPVAFAESYYKQCIRNPQVASNPCYGKDLSFSQMLDIKWFNQHLDYRGFVQECKEVFGNSTVSVFKYSGDVVQEVINLLGLSTPHDNPTPRRNISLNSATIEMIRIINRANLKAKEKELLIPHLRSINELMENYKDKGFVNTETRKKVLALARPL